MSSYKMTRSSHSTQPRVRLVLKSHNCEWTWRQVQTIIGRQFAEPAKPNLFGSASLQYSELSPSDAQDRHQAASDIDLARCSSTPIVDTKLSRRARRFSASSG